MPHQCTGCGHVFPDGSKEMLSGCPDCGGNKFQFQPRGRGGDGPSASAGGASDSAGSAHGATAGGDGPAAEPPEPPEPSGPGGVAGTVAGATERVRDLVSGDDREWPAVGREDPDGGALARSANEDRAQASARSGFVEPDELPEREARAEGAPRNVRTGSGATREREPAPEASAGPAAPTGGDAADPAPERAREGLEPGSAPFTGTGDRTDDPDEDRPDLDELRAELNDQFESIRIVERGQYELNLMELYDREEYIISLMEDGRYAIEVPESWRGD